MRILYFTRNYTIHDRRFLRSFVERRVEIGLLSLQDSSQRIASLGIPEAVVRLGNMSVVNGADTSALDAIGRRYAQILTRFSPDLVLAGPVHDCGYVASQNDTDSLCIPQSWAFDVLWESQRDRQAAERTATTLNSSDAIFADCQTVIDKCRQIAGKRLEYEFIMPWGIDLSAVASHKSLWNIRERYQLHGRLLFLHTRGFETVYGVETLLEAFFKVWQQNRDVALLLMGDGTGKPWVEEFVKARSLSSAVVFSGRVDNENMLNFYTSADCYISTALCDGSSISLIEAMACGLPVIVSDLSANREWVRDGEGGWLAHPGDSGAFADAMLRMTRSDNCSRAAAGKRNHTVAFARADWQGNFTALLAFLKKRVEASK